MTLEEYNEYHKELRELEANWASAHASGDSLRIKNARDALYFCRSKYIERLDKEGLVGAGTT